MRNLQYGLGFLSGHASRSALVSQRQVYAVSAQLVEKCLRLFVTYAQIVQL